MAFSSPPSSQLWGRFEPGSQFLTVFSVVIAFYFGTQAEKKTGGGANG